MKVYLFDWGDTLMVDFPGVSGKMCDWQTVQAVAGAKEVLKSLCKDAKIYIATGAADSTELEIKQAFERVGLSQYISGYFCKANLGLAKGTPEFLTLIMDKLNIAAADVTMVGDNLEKDIKPAIALGIQAFWLTKDNAVAVPEQITVINQLRALHI